MQTQIFLPAPTPQITIHHGKAVTTSQNIASFFVKRHTHVLEKIEALDCSPEFASANFSAHVENIKAGAVNRDSKYYQITRDGFTFLAMSFTGKKAARFKEAYIAEFNRMEELITSSREKMNSTNMHALKVHAQIIIDAWRFDIQPALLAVQSPLASKLHDHFMSAAVLINGMDDRNSIKITNKRKLR